MLIHNLSVSFGGTYLFEEVTFRLGAGDRVGLVGKMEQEIYHA
jgi:ATP-binding cassette subfamily F protein 3